MTLVLALFAGAGGLAMLILALREGVRSGSIRDAGFVSALAAVALVMAIATVALIQT